MDITASHLLKDEIDYELRIRNIITTRDVQEKRKILGTAFRKEKKNPVVFNDPNFDFKVDLVQINSTLSSIQALVDEFEGNTSDSMYKRVKSRLAHVGGRIRRMPIDPQVAEQVDFKNESYATCSLLEAELEEKVIDNSTASGVSNLNTLFVPTSPLPIQTTSPVNHSKQIPIYKWDLKFDGTKKTLGVKSFLERVDELATARKVSKEQLFEGALDFFTGKALLWYRFVKESPDIKCWDSLAHRLQQDFLSRDYDEELWETIKHRKQQSDEPIIVFVSVMEQLFNRLGTKPAVTTKVKWIQKNLRPDFVEKLALNKYDTIESLIKDVKSLEEVFRDLQSRSKPKINSISAELDSEFNICSISDEKQNKNDFHKTNSNNFKNYSKFQKPYKGNKSNNFPSSSKAHFNNFSHKKKVFTNDHPSTSKDVNSTRKEIVCYNCHLPNHHWKHCLKPRETFCFGCGEHDVTINNCGKCQGNDSRR